MISLSSQTKQPDTEIELQEIEITEDEETGKKFYDTATTTTTSQTPIIKKDQPIIALENIHKTYLLGIEGVPALRGVSLQIFPGEFICIYGTSGGGKTSLLNVIGTIDRPTKGSLSICGTRITGNTPDKELAHIRLKNLGFVFQTFNLLSSLSALENVEMPMILSGHLSPSERRARAKNLLTRVGMGKRFDHLPSQLSGGEQQRVTIARAIANQPSILLLDEPTGDLDTMNTTIVMKLLTELNQNENITLVMVTHDVSLKYFADRIVWLRDGKIQRIEQVDKTQREQTYAKLDQDHRTIELSRGGGGGGGGGLMSGIGAERFEEGLEGAPRSNTQTISFENTMIRKPTDYMFHPRPLA